jgi:hypothetical protein
MIADLTRFLTKLRILNPSVRIVLTVSPVHLVATYEPRHVLLSTTYSKAALRVVAEMVIGAFENIAYFPSYEIIAGPQARGQYYAEDLREVTPAGVAHVMSIFKRHYLNKEYRKPPLVAPGQKRVSAQILRDRARATNDIQVVCDEEILDA